MLPFEEHCNDIYSNPLIRDHRDSFLNFTKKLVNQVLRDIPFTVVFNQVENKFIEIFSDTINPKDNYTSIQVVFVHLMNKLQETNDLLQEPLFISSAINQLRKTDSFEAPEADKIRKNHSPDKWLSGDLVQINAFQYLFLTINRSRYCNHTQTILYSLLLRNFSQLNY